jgi:hypothetical protein
MRIIIKLAIRIIVELAVIYFKNNDDFDFLG